MSFKAFILDVDGVMTNGQSLYSEAGKQMKIFGPDDNDGLRLLNPYLKIRFVTGADPVQYGVASENSNFEIEVGVGSATGTLIDAFPNRFSNILVDTNMNLRITNFTNYSAATNIDAGVNDNNIFIGHNFSGKYLDCGSMKGYINSSLEIVKK